MYGTEPDVPDALAVRSASSRRRRLVPADTIEQIDSRSGVIVGIGRDAVLQLPQPVHVSPRPAKHLGTPDTSGAWHRVYGPTEG